MRQLYINTEIVDKYSQEFLIKKITNKLITKIKDPLVLLSASLPSWVEDLTYTSPFLFPDETAVLLHGLWCQQVHCVASASEEAGTERKKWTRVESSRATRV